MLFRSPAGEKEPPVVEEKPEQQGLDSGGLKDAQPLATVVAKGGNQDQSAGNAGLLFVLWRGKRMLTHFLDSDDGDEGHRATKSVEENVQPPNASNGGGDENFAPSSTGNKEDDLTVNAQQAVDIESLNTLPPPRLSFRVNLGSKLESISDPGRLHLSGLIILSTIVFIISGAFGAVHCLAWNSDFPSHVERIFWQVSSVLVTSIGAGLMAIAGHVSPKYGKRTIIIGFSIAAPFIVAYCCARLALLVLAFLQLRDLPFDAYLTPSWTVFYPHIN